MASNRMLPFFLFALVCVAAAVANDAPKAADENARVKKAVVIPPSGYYNGYGYPYGYGYGYPYGYGGAYDAYRPAARYDDGKYRPGVYDTGKYRASAYDDGKYYPGKYEPAAVTAPAVASYYNRYYNPYYAAYYPQYYHNNGRYPVASPPYAYQPYVY